MIDQYKIVMFDMDGTFIDSRKFHAEVFYRFFQQRIMPVSMKDVEAGIGNTVRDIFQSFGIEERMFPQLFLELDAFYRTQIDDLIEQIELVPDIKDTLDALKEQGISTAVVTNSMYSVVERILEIHHLEDRFKIVSGADIESLNKNKRCEKVRLQAEAKPREVLYVGDAKSDVVLAKQMGYKSCFTDTSISWCNNKEYVISKLRPDYTVNNLFQITGIVKGEKNG